MTELIGLILGGVGTLFLGIAAILTRGMDKAKVRIDYNEALWRTLQAHMETLTKENEGLRKRIEALENEDRERQERERQLQEDNFRLSQQIARLQNAQRS